MPQITGYLFTYVAPCYDTCIVIDGIGQHLIGRKSLVTSKQSTKEELLILVASLYYVENLGQAKVAQLAGISQANVSRLLSEARKRGIVQINVKPFSPRAQDLEDNLKDRKSVV